MTATARRRVSKKALVIIASLLVLLVAAGVAYWMLFRGGTLQEDAKQLKTYNDAASLAKTDGIIADGDLKTAYIAYVKANRLSDAKALFTHAIAAKSDPGAKSDLLLQEVSLALQYNQVDEAEAAALQAISVQPSEGAYDAAIRVYAVRGDLTKQREYLVKARDSVQGSDPARKAAQVDMYNERIALIDGLPHAN